MNEDIKLWIIRFETRYMTHTGDGACVDWMKASSDIDFPKYIEFRRFLRTPK